MVKLYIVQHGQASSKLENPLRPLTEQGIYDVKQLAKELHARSIEPAHIFHSGKERAHQTADLIAEALGSTDRVKQMDGLAPNDDATAFASYIKPYADDVLIASHMPFVNALCDALLGDDGVGDFEFAPGRVVCIDIEEYKPTLQWVI